MKIRPNFSLKEFVPPKIWRQFGKSSRWFIDERILDLAQFTREFFDRPMIINNWHVGGDFTERGYRLPNTDTGATYSQHKYGRAIDFNVAGQSADKTREVIFDNESAFMEEGLTTLEHGDIADTWVHADIRNTNRDEIFIVTP